MHSLFPDNRQRSHIALLFLLGLSLSIFISGCSKGSQGEIFVLKRIFNERVDTNASICVAKNELHLFANLNGLEALANKDTLYSVKHFISLDNDSFLPDEISLGLDKPAYKNLLEKQLQTSTCFDLLDSYNFVYDAAVPRNLPRKKSEAIQKVLSVETVSVYTSFDAGTKSNHVHVLSNGIHQQISAGREKETPDFFIYDVTGDMTPEIFVVRHIRTKGISDRQLPAIQLEVYKMLKL